MRSRQIYEHFDSINFKWSTIDPICFTEVGGEPGPLYIWVGVMNGTPLRKDARNAAAHCKHILAKSQFATFEIAFCESVFTRSAGPQFLKCNRYFDPSVPLANVRYSCTPTLGVPIAPKAFSQFGGTGRLYLREGGERNRVLLLTARHGVLPSSEYRNEFYERKMPRREVILLGNKAFENVLTSVMCKIGHGIVTVDHYKNSLAYLGETAEGEDATGVKMRE